MSEKQANLGWFLGPSVISIYQYGVERGFIDPDVAAKALGRLPEADNLTHLLSPTSVSQDVAKILDPDPKAFDLMSKNLGVAHGQVTRWSYAVSQETLKEAIQCVADTRLLDNNLVLISTVETDRTFAVRLIPKIPIYDWHHHLFALQFSAGMGRLIDSGVLPLKRLIYRGEVMSVEEHQARNPDLSLMSDQITELQWQIEDVMQPSNMANKVQALQFRSMIQPTLEARKGLTAATDAVLAFMDAGFHKQESVSLSAAAFSMNMEASTLRRRLAAEGAKFSYLLRDYRAKASVCLLMSGLAVKEVSQQLGYAEPSAFQHAFQQWYDLPPKRYLRARQSTKTRA